MTLHYLIKQTRRYMRIHPTLSRRAAMAVAIQDDKDVRRMMRRMGI